VRLSRRRFWKGELTADKKAAYETLFECLTTISQLMSPVAPFFAEWLYKNLTDSLREKELAANSKFKAASIHLSLLGEANLDLINERLNESMLLAQNISSMVLSLRKKVSINVRQPLARILIPSLGKEIDAKIEDVKHLILSETNIKNIEYLTDSHGFIQKKIKPNFKALGAKVGKDMKEVAAALTALDQDQIIAFEKNGQFTLANSPYTIAIEDVEIVAEDIPGWLVNVMGKITVALDVSISEDLRLEGLAREIINRIQNLRKDKGFEVTDKISVRILDNDYIKEAINKNLNYICAEILATEMLFVAGDLLNKERVEINEKEVYISIEKDS
jgi:isoleucyl-tRNA synthetase